MSCPIMHFEINGPDPKALQQFYGDLFDWKVSADNPMGYGMVEAVEGQGIGGGIAETEDGKPETLIYVVVDDVARYLEKVTSLGGETVLARTVIPGMVTYGKFRDPQGNLVGIVEEATPPAE